MNIIFNTDARRKITEANINFYNRPFVHPKRKMQDHDFIYLLEGEWKIGQCSEIFTLKKDTVLILSAGQTHYGASVSKENTKTMYFHVESVQNDLFNTYSEDPSDTVIECLTDVSNNGAIKKIFYDIVTAKLYGNEKKASILFDLLLNELASINRSTSPSSAVEKIKSLIQQNPERFFSNSELAKTVSLSVKTAETKFKSHYNMTIHQYMLNYKV